MDRLRLALKEMRLRWLAGLGGAAALCGLAVSASEAPAVFPGSDGLLVAFARDFDLNVDLIVTIDPESGTTTRILSDGDDYLDDVHWSPDGTLIGFTRVSMDTGRSSAWTVNPDGTGEATAGRGSVLDFSPDGSKILIGTPGGGIGTVNLDGSGRRTVVERSELLRRGHGYLTDAAWSPTGKWIAYDATKRSGSNRRSLYLIHPDGTGKKPLPSLSGGSEPEWSPDGKTLFYARNTKIPVKILALKLGAKRPVKLTKGYSPAVSPSGSTLAFARVDDLYTMGIHGGPSEHKLIPSPATDVDASNGLEWQPVP